MKVRRAIDHNPHWCSGAVVFLFMASSQVPAQTELPVPRLVERDGRYALLVHDAPYLILGAQTNSSSNYPALLPKVWPAVEGMHANMLVIPVAWEQVEPEEGTFVFSFVDTLITEARKRDLRLVLLWFATWKNNGWNGDQNDWGLNFSGNPHVQKVRLATYELEKRANRKRNAN